MEPKNSNIIPEPDTITKGKKRTRKRPINIPQYHVVLLDDNDHTYEYVVEMLMNTFRHSPSRAFEMAVEVDGRGRVIVDTTTKERAELKRDQIHSYGADWRIPHCRGSMSAIITPAGKEG